MPLEPLVQLILDEPSTTIEERFFPKWEIGMGGKRLPTASLGGWFTVAMGFGFGFVDRSELGVVFSHCIRTRAKRVLEGRGSCCVMGNVAHRTGSGDLLVWDLDVAGFLSSLAYSGARRAWTLFPSRQPQLVSA